MISKSQVKYDPEADVLYLYSRDGEIARSVEVSPGVTIEYDEEGAVLGLEVLRASRILARKIVASIHAKQAGVL